MYLTRFTLNTARRDARKLLTSPQAMHAAVLAGFPDPEIGNAHDARPLWRVDHGPHRRATLYIASPGKPDLTHLVEQAGWPAAEQSWETQAYAPLLERLRPGQRWAFRLTANPTRDGRPRDGRAGDTRRYGHVTEAQQRQWLLDRTAGHGFTIPTTSAGEPDLAVHRRTTQTFHKNGHEVTLRIVSYDGHLDVADVEKLRKALASGIGHAKAYGCGLLTLANPT